MSTIDRIGDEPREPTVTEDDLNEYSGEEGEEFNLTDHRHVAVTYDEGVYGSDCTLNGDVVKTITGEDVRRILSVDEEANDPAQVTPEVAGEKFAAWDMPYLVGDDGDLQPRYGQSSEVVYDSSTSQHHQDIDVIE